MSVFKFRYKKLGPKFIRPIIKVEVLNKSGSKSCKYEVLVDSGADLSIFDAEIAALLDIDLESGQEARVYGITSGEPEPYYMHEVWINVGGHKYKTVVGFKRGLNDSYGVVGQTGFFDEFVVKFDLMKEEVELKERI